MTIKSMFISGAALTLLTGAAWAADVEIQWDDVDSFSDVEAGSNQSQRRFQEQVVDELSMHFREAAEAHLDDDQTLRLLIRDVDLAGDVEYFFTRFDNGGVRVIRDVYFPSIECSYELLNEDGEVIKQGDENVRDIGFRHAGLDHMDQAPLDYEKELIDSWF